VSNGTITKGEGYQPGDGSTDTGRTAMPRGALAATPAFGLGRGPPAKKDIPFVRHTSVKIFIGLDQGGVDDQSVSAKDHALEQYEEWKASSTAKHYRLAEMRFEFVTESKFALYIIYSE
jgi:hypothetical protein